MAGTIGHEAVAAKMVAVEEEEAVFVGVRVTANAGGNSLSGQEVGAALDGDHNPRKKGYGQAVGSSTLSDLEDFTPAKRPANPQSSIK